MNMEKFEQKPMERAPLTESEKQKWEIISKDIPSLAQQFAEEEVGKRWTGEVSGEKEIQRTGSVEETRKEIEAELKELFTEYKEQVNSAEDLKALYENKHRKQT